MERFIPQFLTSSAEEANTANDRMNDNQPEPPLTRSRSANLSAPITRHHAILAARRSPSPSAANHFFPETTATTMAEQETIRALTEALRGMKASSRMPEIPNFDPKNIEIWIKRVDNAYRRAGVTDPKDKFAYIESKIQVDADARIQSFIFGEGTSEEWTAFMDYLKDRYGRTKSQQAAVILDGVKRDGRLPSEMFSFIKEKIGNLTIDDIVKEMVVRELPTDIQRTIHEQTKSLNGADATKLADSFFDKDGKPIHRTASSTVNNIDECPAQAETESEEDDVNAVGRQKPKSRQFKTGKQQYRNPNSKTPWAPRPRGPQSNHQQHNNRPAPNPTFEKHENRGTPTVRNVKLCKFHQFYGDSARTCESNCIMYSKWAGNAKAGRQT